MRVDEMMKSQRAFLADSSHELRRPLTIIRTDIDVINDPRLTAEERETIEAEMREEAQSMSKLISDLHLLAREQLVEMRYDTFDLSKVCENAIESTLRRYGTLHRFDAQIPPAVNATGDAEQLERALLNLLENACVYTPAGGLVSLSLEARANGFRIVVQDSGIGMSDEDASRVFDRFYRAKGSQAIKPDGFGLGLAIVKQILEAHEGSIQVRSVLGKGSAFCLDLPELPPSVLTRDT
jgi:two-component system phosphate regulon sensor histidine kinase PhoR